MSSYVEADEAFKNAMLDSIGYAPETIIADDKLHRFTDQNGKLNCAYILHLDGHPAGYFQDFKQGIKQNWKLEGDYPKLSEQQRVDFKIEAHRQRLIRQQEELAKHTTAANKALYIWNPAPLAPANYPYFVKKRVKPHGARLSTDGRLIIPLQNSEGQLVNLQFISATGEKRFLAGGLKKGCFHILDGKTDAILICEGAATGFSLFEATGHLTVIAFDAGNLKKVAINIKALYPSSDIVICGDNDLSGVGQQKAIEAALAINGKYIIPETPGQDWNDSLTMEVNHA